MNFLSQLAQSLHEKGVMRTVLILFAHIQDLAFDFKYKTDTLRWQELNSISVAGENKVHGFRYQPTQARTLRKVFKTVNPSRDGTFLDLGCGKGRALILAAEFGYRRVLGVEFSELLCQIAQTNLSRYSRDFSPTTEFRVIHTDAGDYAIPEDVSTVFMFNPFDEVVMTKVVKNIEGSLRNHPRKLYIIYRNPLHRYLFDSSGMLQVIARYSFPQCDFLVYATGDGMTHAKLHFPTRDLPL